MAKSTEKVDFMKRIDMSICVACNTAQLATRSEGMPCLVCKKPLPAFETSEECMQDDDFSIAREGKTALLIALQFTGLPDAMRGSILLSALVMPSILIPMAFWAHGSLSSGYAMASVLGIFMVALLWLSPLRVMLSKRSLRVVLRRIQKACLFGNLRTSCPECDQRIVSPPFDAAFQCPACRVELLSSDGVIVSRAEREESRVAAWTLRAKKLVDADRIAHQSIHLRNRIFSKILIAANVILPVLALLAFLFLDQRLL